MIIVRVVRPAAWCFAPLRHSDLVRDPALSGEGWESDGDLNWRQIADAVSDAVQFSQRELADPMTPEVEVAIEPLPEREAFIVGEWLGSRPPEFGPATGEVTDGRHRTWYSRHAGASEAPVLNSYVADAVLAWNDAAGNYGGPDSTTLGFWLEERQWWESPEASNWAVRNRTHLRLWDRVLFLWGEKLGRT